AGSRRAGNEGRKPCRSDGTPRGAAAEETALVCPQIGCRKVIREARIPTCQRVEIGQILSSTDCTLVSEQSLFPWNKTGIPSSSAETLQGETLCPDDDVINAAGVE